MKTPARQQRSNPFTHLALLGAGAALLIGILGLWGWISGLLLLGSIHSSYIPIASSTCIAFIVQGAVFIVYIYCPLRARQWPFVVPAATTVVFGMLTLVGYYVGSEMNFESLVFSSYGRFGSFPTNRMSPLTGALFALSGTALLLLVRFDTYKAVSHLASGLAGIAAISGLIGTIGYLYGTPLLYVGTTIPMALTTSVAFMFLGAGLLAAAGPGTFLLRPLTGNSIRATLLRTFMPLGFVAVIVSNIFEHFITRLNSALVSAASAIIFGMVTVAVVVQAARRIGKTIETAEEERRRAEDALRDSEERYRQMAENIKEVFWLANSEQTELIYVSPAYEEIWGSTCASLYADPNSWLAAVHPDDRRQLDEALLQRTIGRYDAEYRIVRTDGTIRWVRDRGFPIRNGAGKVYRVAGIAEDITEQKLAKEALRESRQQWANIIDFLPDPTFVIDRKGRVIAWNKAVEEMTGVKAADMLGKDNYEYALPFHGERRPILIDLVLDPREDVAARYVGASKKGSRVVGETYISTLGSRKAYVFGTASALRDLNGNIVGAIESLRDITERKLVEEALARAEEKYRSIFENAIVGIYQSTTEGRFISVNAAFAQMLGYDSPEQILDTLTDLSRQLYVDPEQRSELLRLIEEHGMVQGLEVELCRKDGSIAWVIVNVRAVRDPDGKIAYLESSALDITERKLAEREKANLECRLHQSQKMEAIGTLAGGIAHDFNNILGAILGYTELAMLDTPKETPIWSSLSHVIEGCNRARDLVRQILTFSRQGELEQSPLQLTVIFKEALKLLQATLPSTIEIRQKIEVSQPGGGVIWANPTQIHQVIMNLSANAAHAMQDRGTLEATVSEVDLDEFSPARPHDLCPGRYMKLTISDTGHGIDRAVMERIFDPFFTTKGPGEGTGLGLAVVHGIIKSHGGAITVESEPAIGTTFSVYLPRMEREKALETAISTSPPTGKECILFVDDERALVDVSKRLLEYLGYEVVARTDSTEALETFRADPDKFDLVMTDLTMPKMTGVELAGSILDIRAEVPIILCSGFSEVITPEKARTIGIRELVMKPMVINDIAVTIRRILDSRQEKG